jgi:hypothetical protein
MTTTNLNPYSCCSLTDEQVLDILVNADCTALQKAQEIGCPARVVLSVRNGTTYKHLFPDVPRPGNGKAKGPRCDACVHYNEKGKCTLGIVEYSTAKTRAAVHCAYYATEPVRMYG